jgi:glycogen(starch) synthase
MTLPPAPLPRSTERPVDLPQLLVVTPWYPTADNPYAGAFVRESVRSLLPYYEDILIIHVENVPEDDDRVPFWSETAEGRVLWIPAAMDPMTSRGGMILEQRAALERHALPYLQHAASIHCHVGAPTGAALVPLVPGTTRLMITEHATYLSKVLADPLGRELYEGAVRRADVFTAVSARTAWMIETTYPEARDHVTVIANPVPLGSLPVKRDLTAAMSRWLYVGNLVEHKGVRRLLRSFAQWVGYSRDPRSRLTLAGDGHLREELEALAVDLGVGDRVTFLGRVEPDEVGRVYAQHDLLVHLSHVETFGLTCVEAAAVGLPVVATTSGGPESTLVVHAALGLAELVPVSTDEHDVEPVVEAVARLQRSVDADNMHLSRQHLQRSYGAETVGALLHSLLVGKSLPARPVHPGMRLLAVAMSGKQARAAEAALANFASFGGGGTYITAVPPSTVLPPTVRVVDISGIEKHTLLSQVERLLVLRAPALGLRGLGRIARLVRTVSPAAGQRATSAVSRLQHTHRRAAHAFRHRGPYNVLWRNVGPWYAARTMEIAGTFQALDLKNIDCVILPDEFMTPIVVRALRVNPDLDVRSRWTRRAIARLYADRVLGTDPGSGTGVELAVDGQDDATGAGTVSSADAGGETTVPDPSSPVRDDNIRS